MKLDDGSNKTKIVNMGLVDDRGCFFLLLDDNETKYYKFSDQASLVKQLIDENKMLIAENEKLLERNEKLIDNNNRLESQLKDLEEKSK